MSFSHPIWLLGLLAVPLLWLAYRARDRRARRFAVRFPAASTLGLAAGAVPAWRRHLPAALALAALVPLVLALGKPHAAASVPIQRASIVLVTDHSGSMDASDVLPTRLLAAERAANSFIDKVPASIRVGVVTYSGGTDAVQAPTTDHDAVRRVINSQSAEGTTATGDALAAALALLRRDKTNPPSAIVLLSDGTTNAGAEPVGVATQAGQKRIPIYTVALGTEGATLQNPNDPNGPGVDVSPDPETLREIARVSGGQAYTADDGARLNSIYKNLGSRLGSRKVQRELTAGFAIGGLVLLLAAAGASQLRWRRRPVSV